MTDIIDQANLDAIRFVSEQLRYKALIANDVTDCIDCGEPIGEKRKQALPSAVRCINCQKTREQRR